MDVAANGLRRYTRPTKTGQQCRILRLAKRGGELHPEGIEGIIRGRFYRMSEKSKREVHPQAREYFDKGIAALRKDNLDYATKLFEQALKREPGFFECREALRLNQFKRA